MTERAFLIDLLLDDKLPKRFKTMIGDRIKELESQPMQTISRPQAFPMAQSQSTLENLAKQTGSPVVDAPIPNTHAPLVSQRIVGGEVQTGNGTRGPRKF